MVDAIMVRANVHEDLERLALNATVPVINGLSDKGHPCQIVADLMTIEEHRGDLRGKTIAWVGDGNNVCASFLHAAGKLGYRLRVASPAAFAPRDADVGRAREANGEIELSDDPAPLSKKMGWELLKNDPTPLSTKMGWAVLKD